MIIRIFTDGSSNNRIAIDNRVGGYSALILTGKTIKLKGAQLSLTSQQAEMMAVIIGLFHCYENHPESEVEIYSDSAYIVNCFRDRWYEDWITKDWFLVKNREYWETMLDLVFNRGLKVKFIKVKGHAGVEFNEEADRLALEARQELERELQ